MRAIFIVVVVAAIIAIVNLLSSVPQKNENVWTDETATPCEKNIKSCSPCGGGPEGLCYNAFNKKQRHWSPYKPDGTWRVFKKPNYYGWGAPNAWHYGEPYYARAVKY
jgi:hypothetical protein